MSIIDKALGAITPPESEEKRAEATRTARGLTQGADWLAMALDHHEQIRSAFESCLATQDAQARLQAMKTLALVLNGHSLAEEIVLYPAMAKAGEKGHAGMAYTEQTTAKMQMAELERIDPSTPDWAAKVEHIRGAVLHHMYEEEGTWFPELKRDFEDQTFLTRRFHEEYERYAGGREQGATAMSATSAEPRSFAPDQGEASPNA
ncbi:MAG TPA: hemerythrin domain-containing protein [Phenylobacterium sp.]